MEESILCQVWKTVRVEAGPRPFQGYWSIQESMLFDFRFLNETLPQNEVPALGQWTWQADRIVHPGNEAALYLSVQVVTAQYLVLELHMLYSGEARHTLTLSLVPSAAVVD